MIFEINESIVNYFSKMEMPEEATIYDYLILGLRSKDIIATFNWDPFLAKAFQRNMEVIGYEHMPQITFLHGNVSIGVCHSCKTKGWRYNYCDKCHKQFGPSQLLYPVGHKDYSSDKFIYSEWKNVQHQIKYAYLFSVFGYSAPITDIEARTLLLDVWSENESRELAYIGLIDIKSSDEVKQNWKDFIIRDKCSITDDLFKTYFSLHPRRSCDAYAMATLQQHPWKDNPFPKNISLSKLQEWIMPLIEEEKIGRFSGEPCNRFNMDIA